MISTDITDISLDRWVNGHHAFIAIDKIQLAVIGNVNAALDSLDYFVAAAGVQSLVCLQRASAILVRSTSNFKDELYQKVIRPHMAAYDPEMSGVYMADHKHLIRGITELMKRVDDIDPLPPMLASAKRAFEISRSSQLDAHSRACRENIPEDAQSMIGEAKGNDRPAVQVIEQDFNRLRRKQAGCPFHGS